MKIYKNQTAQSVKSLGLSANFAFASDKNMSPNGIDITPVTKDGQTVHIEVTEYDDVTKTARIMLMSGSEFNEYKKKPQSLYVGKYKILD